MTKSYEPHVEIMADSLNSNGKRMTTICVHNFPKVLLQETATHRIINQMSTLETPVLAFDINPFGAQLSRNVGSSRAIPFNKVLEQVTNDPFIPTWTLHQKGMGGSEEIDYPTQLKAISAWDYGRAHAIEQAKKLYEAGLAKEIINRPLEPYMKVPLLMSATEWDNFLELRTAQGAQVDFRKVAIRIKELMVESEPKCLESGDWHVPFFISNEKSDTIPLKDKIKIAVARSARVSYNTHTGGNDVNEHYRLHDFLLEHKHMSPFEHVARASKLNASFANLVGFRSYRNILESGEEIA